MKLLLAFAAVTFAATTAHAQVEIGVTSGVHTFSKNNELGVPDRADADSHRNSALFALRLGGMFNDYLGLEGEVGAIPTEARSMASSVFDLTYRGHALAQLRGDKPENKVLPFMIVGLAGMSVAKSDGNVFTKDNDPALYTGLGAKFRLDAGFGVRLETRLLFPPSSRETRAATDFEGLISLYKEWGRKEKKEPPPPPPPPDSDGDGLIDPDDKCPLEAEDKDMWQDEDGCPDPDNDQDGIADLDDRCPLDAEDKDGFEDADGCPELDNDADGLADTVDKCPMEAEDKDAFEDDDGCPDPDNDQDTILDGADACPNQPETKNGYQDEDGCPDEVPEKVKKFTGVIKGINFKVNSDALLPNSFKTLDNAVRVLLEYPDLKMEIQGHTDDQKFRKQRRGKFTNNQELSQGRAESVRAYLIKKGVDANRLTAKGFGESQPVESPAGLKGRKLATARAKNRRVEFRLTSSLVP